VGGIHAFFIVRGDPRTYNLPPQPDVPTIYQRKAWTSAAAAAGLVFGTMLLAFLTRKES
jgi:formate dehydrogenase iron-sulfur subunit